jgi:hypothetical protein
VKKIAQHHGGDVRVSVNTSGEFSIVIKI